MKRVGQVELWKYGTVVLHVKVNEGRIEPKQKQAVAHGERIVKNPITRTHNDVAERLPRQTKPRTEIIAVGIIKRLWRCFESARHRIEIGHQPCAS